MPLSGEAKKIYQREYMRRRRSKVIPKSDPSEEVKNQSLIKIPGLVMEGNRIVGIEKKVNSTNELPICTERNYRQFKIGEKVRIWRGSKLVEVEVPEIDAEGNPM